MKPDSFRVLFVSKDPTRFFGYAKLTDPDEWWGGELDGLGTPLDRARNGKYVATRKLAIAEAVARASAAGIDTRRPGESNGEGAGASTSPKGTPSADAVAEAPR